MASDTSVIDPGDEGGAIEIAPVDVVGAATATAAAACLSCAAAITGPYCSTCGQRNDDMRRSSLVLARDFLKDTFAFDSRMWRTLGLMAISPGKVPASYSHGRRSRYTPPVRMFLFVSFLFFLTFGLTGTMFVAIDVTAKTPEQIASENANYEKALAEAGAEARAALEEAKASQNAVAIDGAKVDCDINLRTRFFVRPQDVSFDEAKWRACAESVSSAAKSEIAVNDNSGATPPAAGEIDEKVILGGFDRVLSGVDQMVANPTAFNASINAWLPRVMFFMAPVLALILGLFIRGKDALLFDHLVLSLYSHATGFAIIGTAIIFAHFGAQGTFAAAMTIFGVYFIAALKRAYGRGWVKTIYSGLFAGLIYLIVLSTTVGVIISNQIWRAAA
ncbi:MAG: hypothetical protein A3E78_06070 [Alphaproteobacteria bacterium RIFCSPHIGHO2_12_FULL_63_12]|nr:MAG: hypothetical protein A3E78_06070 [Alphaproteobacteria bacterium RIFCSPHIGHO2_12_FULL_63_12]